MKEIGKRILPILALLFALAFLVSCVNTGGDGDQTLPAPGGGSGNQGGDSGGSQGGGSGDSGNQGGNQGGNEGGTPDDSRVTYTVTVTDENGTPIPLAWVQFCIGNTCMMPVATGEDGKMTTTLDKGEWKFMVASAPEGYEVSSDYTMTEDGAWEYTVVLAKKAPVDDGRVTYTVTVTDESGNPLADAWVQFCIGNTCMMPIATGEDGKMTTTLDKGEWKFMVAFAPEGYEVSSDYTMTEDGVWEYTVVLTEVAPPEDGGEDEETPGESLESSDDTEGDNFGDFTPFG